MTDSELDRLEPESLLPAQLKPERAWSPEERLCLAVLEISWHDLQGPRRYGGHMGTRKREDYWAAQYWFKSKSDKPFSYIWCCHALGMEPGSVVFTASEPASRVPAPKPGGNGTRVLARLARAI